MKYILVFIFLVFNISNISAFSYEKLIDKKELVKHFTIEEIENIKIPDEWSLVKDINYYDEVIQDYYRDIGSPKIVRELQANNGDQICFDHLKKFDSIIYKTGEEFFKTGTQLDWDSCIMYAKFRQFFGNTLKKIPDRNTDLLKNYLLYYSSTDSFKVQQGDNHYSYWKTLSMLAQMYAVEKNHLGLSDKEIKMINEWFISRATVDLMDIKLQAKRGRCKIAKEYDEEDVLRTAKIYASGNAEPLYQGKTKYRGADDCGTISNAHTVTRLLIGLITNNKELFDKGIIDLKYLMTFIDKDGVYVPYAYRGGLAISYSKEFLFYFSVFAEIFHTLDINFYEITVPSGIKIKDAFDFHYTIWDDVVPEAIIKYAKLNFGNKTHDWTELLKPKKERKTDGLGVYLPGWKETMIRQSIRYVQTYRNDLFGNFDDQLYRKSLGYREQNLFGGNHALNLHAVIRANERYEGYNKNIEDEKKLVALNQKRLKENAKRLRLEKQKELEEQIKKFNELILLSKYKKDDTFLVLPDNELQFTSTQSPLIKKNWEFEFKSARIRGELQYMNQNLKNMNTDKANILYHFGKLDLWAAILKDDETEAVGFFIADPPFDQYLLETNKSIVEKCGRLFKPEKWLVILTKTNRDNKKIINQQKCTRKHYSQENEEIQILYSILSKSAPAIKYYLENNL